MDFRARKNRKSKSLEIADMAEQMAVVGISRYTIDQMLELNVSDFFQN